MKIKELIDKYFKEVIKESPEISDEITAIFEGEVSATIKEKMELKEKEFETANTKDLKEFKESLVDKLDEYIELSMKEFVTENKINIEKGMKIDLAEKTFSAIKTLFTEADIKIPEGEIDSVKELKENITALSAKLNEAVNSDIDSKKQVLEYEKSMKFVSMTEDLSDTSKEKLLTLLENINCADIEDFEKKVTILKETVIEKKEEDKKDKDGKTLLEGADDFKPSDLDKYLP